MAVGEGHDPDFITGLYVYDREGKLSQQQTAGMQLGIRTANWSAEAGAFTKALDRKLDRVYTIPPHKLLR